MVKYNYKNARFVKSATNAKEYPLLKNSKGQPVFEIAVAGRSNVGKSSLLNHLFQQKGLVKTSSTPGKTQLVNFFNIEDQLMFVDLPGYGYAKVPQEIRKEWGPMIEAYLDQRESLHLILLLLDIRRLPNEEDRQLLQWAIARQKAVILILTKVDKVNESEKKKNTADILQALNVGNLHYIYYSVPKNIGRQALVTIIADAIEDEGGL